MLDEFDLELEELDEFLDYTQTSLEEYQEEVDKFYNEYFE